MHVLIIIVAVNEWTSSFERRILPFMNTKIVLDDAEIVRLGKKLPNEYPYCSSKFCILCLVHLEYVVHFCIGLNL